MYLNAQSLVGKVNELSAAACDLNPDIIMVTESWCNSDISDAYLSINGYELKTELRMDRGDTGGGRGGGLIVYARSGLQILKLDQAVRHIQLVKFKVSDIILHLVYRPPSAPVDSITELAAIVKGAAKGSLLVGDFNLPDIDWARGEARGRAGEFCEAVRDSLMEQLVDFPTQVKGNTLDLVLTNIPERVDEVSEEGRLGKSDHTIIVTKVNVGAAAEDDKPSPDWRRANWDSMREELQRGDWLRRLRSSRATQAWDILTEKVEGLIQKYVPDRKKKNPNRPPWMTQGILRAIRRKKRIWLKVRNSGATDEYRAAEKEVRNLIRNSKRSFEKRLATGSGGSNRPFYAYVKQKTQSRPSVGPLKDENSRVVSGNAEMAELLNQNFSDIFTREDVSEIPDAEDMRPESELATVKFRESDVRKKIREQRTDAAAGPDGIGPRVLKELQDGLVPALTAIFTKSMEEGSVPPDWKDANVTPIFKKGSKSAPGNYRPVSLTSVSCKLMESIIRDSVTEHLSSNNLIGKSQHGFLRGRSCVTNLLEFLEKATTVVDSGEGFDVIYLDFAKAFDKVPTERLLRKVRAHGIRGQVLDWIRDWLTGRRQRVVLNGRFSSWADVLSGVPQGSVLGPLLFVIFINDMDSAVSQVDILRKFADDTKIGQKVMDARDRHTLQTALDRLCEWADKWGMQFNVSKCKVMHMGRLNPRLTYSMGGLDLEETEEERDIGVVVSANLKPSAQCARAANTAQAVLGQLSRAFHYRDRHIFVRLYKQYVRPHLEFSTQAWSPWTEGDKNCLEKIQERTVRMVAGLKGTTYEERLEELGLPTLVERRHQADMQMVHKILHGRGNLDYTAWFEKAENGPRATRSAADPLNLRPNHGRLELRSNFFSVRVVQSWNAIPGSTKSIVNSDRFVREYRRQRANPMQPAT
jgi:hypothetical protein